MRFLTSSLSAVVKVNYRAVNPIPVMLNWLDWVGKSGVGGVEWSGVEWRGVAWHLPLLLLARY